MARKYKILAVDDDATTLILVKEILGNEYHVQTTSSGLKALQWLKTASFDLVITDLNMPEIDGRQLNATIKNQHPGLPVILITASFEEGYPNYSKANRSEVLLPKPLDINLFTETIKLLLNNNSPEEFPKNPYYNIAKKNYYSSFLNWRAFSRQKEQNNI